VVTDHRHVHKLGWKLSVGVIKIATFLGINVQLLAKVTHVDNESLLWLL
jgi:type III secretory pathway component EscS